MPDEELTTPVETGEEEVEEKIEETPAETGGEPEPTEAKEAEETEKVVSFEDHQKLQARLAFAERELRRKGREEPAEPKKPEAAQTTQEPKESDFEDYNEFVRASARYEAKAEFESLQKSSREKTEKEKVIERDRKIDTIIAAEKVKDPGFLDKVFIPEGLIDLVADSDQFVEMSLYFGKNPEKALALLDLPVVQAAREIGRIESKLQTQTPQPKTTTKAPTPTKTVGGKETVGKTIDDMTTAEHIAYMNKKDFG